MAKAKAKFKKSKKKRKQESSSESESESEESSSEEEKRRKMKKAKRKQREAKAAADEEEVKEPADDAYAQGFKAKTDEKQVSAPDIVPKGQTGLRKLKAPPKANLYQLRNLKNKL